MKMDKGLHRKMLGLHEKCPFTFHHYTQHHKEMFDGFDNKEYFEYMDYAIWLTTMGMIETLIIIDEHQRIIDL